MKKLSSRWKWNIIYFLVIVYLMILSAIQEGQSWIQSDEFEKTLMMLTILLCVIYFQNPVQRRVEFYWFKYSQKPVPWLVSVAVLIMFVFLSFIPAALVLVIWLNIRAFFFT